MHKSENLWIVLVVVLVLVVFGFWSMSQGPAPTAVYNPTPTPGADNTNPPAAVSVEDTSTGSVDAGAPASSIAYGDALIKYKDARLQIDKNCQSTPDKMTFKNNALMMVDNRGSVARTVKIGTSFPIAAYGFKIIKLSSATLPVTWLVDCDKSQNVASILIEK